MTSSIFTSFPTSVPHVYASKSAVAMAESFFSCPQAAQLLESERFIKPIYIESVNAESASTQLKFDEDLLSGATILIPEKYLKTSRALESIAWEIFNTQRTSAGMLGLEAQLGDIGMDALARRIEEVEFADSRGHAKLIKLCGNQWKMSPEETKEYTQEENISLESYLFVQECTCHTDYYRRQWIENYQTIYCEKHPDEKRSCEAKTTDLCDVMEYLSMTAAEQDEFYEKRVCKLFPEAHQTVKNDPIVRKIVLKGCPGVLLNSLFNLRKEL